MHNRQLNDLPAEILLNLFSYLRLTELFQLMLVNTYLSQLLEDRHFWKNKVKQVFPHLLLTSSFLSKKNINWKDEVKFIANLELEYKDLPEVIKNIFIAIRTSDVLLLSRNYEKHNENYLNYRHYPGSQKTFRNRTTIDTPLECAHRMGSAEIFSYFFKLKLEDLECYTLTAEKYSIDLVFAAILFHSPLKSIKDVLTEKMIIKCRDQDGNTLLMLATRHKSAEMGAYLINHGAQINAKNKYGQTALMLATQYGNNDLVKFLLHKEAKKTSNLLQIAAIHQQLIAAKLLLEHGISTQQFDSQEAPPLVIAVKNHDIEMTELLLDYGADVNYAKQYSESPLYYEPLLKNEALIQVLKNHVNIHQEQGFFGKVCATLFGRRQEKEDGMELKTLKTSQKQVSGKDLTSAPSATTISSLRNSSKMI